MDEIKTKQQVLERIKQAEKILITVSDDPSVDSLSAALGLTLLLDKQGKYVTTIYSGATPPAIAFLEPEKTFDNTTDSLRDFIIALNKDKADHLRYKVEGDSVKIFITPYKTTITDADLEFSQGDYNVELVIALGVDQQDHLDGALQSHGQILHDADIITVTVGDQMSDLGGIDWHDSQVSSLSELVAGLAEALKDDKKKPLLDAPIATALLTGIVAQTDRFSNEHTTSRVMTVAAALMSAGADQQLIATELQRAQAIDTDDESDADQDDTAENESSASDSSDADSQDDADDSDQVGDSDDTDDSGATVDQTSGDGSLTIKKDGLRIAHSETLADLDRRVMGEEKAKEKIEDEIEALEEDAENLAKKYPLVDDSSARTSAPAPKKNAKKIHKQPATPTVAIPGSAPALAPSASIAPLALAPAVAPASAYAAVPNGLPEAPVSSSAPAPSSEPLTVPPAPAASTPATAYALDDNATEPLLGGTLNATAEQAADDARREAEDDKNRTILSHAYLGEATTADSGRTEAQAEGFPGTPPVAPGSVGVNGVSSADEVHSAYALQDEPLAALDSATPGAATNSDSQPLAGSANSAEPLTAAAAQPGSFGPAQSTDSTGAQAAAYAAPADLLAPIPSEGLGIGGERVIQPLHDATSLAQPSSPISTASFMDAAATTPPLPTDLGLPLPPPLPDFNAMGPAGMSFPGAPALPLPPSQPTTGLLGDILAPEPPQATGQAFPQGPSPVPQSPTNDPGQFHIPNS